MSKTPTPPRPLPEPAGDPIAPEIRLTDRDPGERIRELEAEMTAEDPDCYDDGETALRYGYYRAARDLGYSEGEADAWAYRLDSEDAEVERMKRGRS